MKAIKVIIATLSRLTPKHYDDSDLMIYFKTEYKKNPVEAYEYWTNTKRDNYCN